MTSRLPSAALALLLVSIPAVAAETARPVPPKSLPPNTINCADWTHNPDGGWTAHHDAKPFEIGSAKRVTMQDERIGRNDVSFGGYDLATVLDEKCGTF